MLWKHKNRATVMYIPKGKPIQLAPQNHNQLSLWNFYPMYAYKQHSSHQSRSCNGSWKEGKPTFKRPTGKQASAENNQKYCKHHAIIQLNTKILSNLALAFGKMNAISASSCSDCVKWKNGKKMINKRGEWHLRRQIANYACACLITLRKFITRQLTNRILQT